MTSLSYFKYKEFEFFLLIVLYNFCIVGMNTFSLYTFIYSIVLSLHNINYSSTNKYTLFVPLLKFVSLFSITSCIISSGGTQTPKREGIGDDSII